MNKTLFFFRKKLSGLTLLSLLFFLQCSDPADHTTGSEDGTSTPEIEYDETGLLYTSYDGLVMAGYQGWFAAEGDESNRGWYHYRNASCGFEPGCSSIDLWPDMSEYKKKYASPFSYEDDSTAYLFSSYDKETIDLHFKWMKEYGIDGVFMQRFLVETQDSQGKKHFNKVLKHALKAAKKYDRAISIMYDLSHTTSDDHPEVLLNDWEELQTEFNLFDNEENPTYLRHNGKPLLGVWGAGFNDGRDYSLADVDLLISSLKGPQNRFSIMLGVPYYWRTLGNDVINSPLLHSIIKKTDIIMPWAVGRYNAETYTEVASPVLTSDLLWLKNNDVDYAPLVFPGFSWNNLKNGTEVYNYVPRDKGNLFWKQVAGAKLAGAKSLYLAMFDEIDEGTAIFKVENNNSVPLNGDKKFVGIDNDLETDYYLWLAGQAARWFKGEGEYGAEKPERVEE